MADVALRPSFPERELDRLRKQALTGLLQMRDSPQALASLALSRALFGDHRYARLAGGDAASLSGLTVTELRDFHARHYRPGNATLIVVGDVKADVVTLLTSAFGAWPAGGERAPALPAPAPPRGRSVWLIDRPAAPQSTVRIGRVGPPRTTPHFHALEVMNAILGGTFSSRLNLNLREAHGYAYGAGSGFSMRRVAGAWSARADVQTPSTAPAVTEMLKELGGIRAPVTDEELSRSRSFIAMSYAEEFETPGQIAGKLAEQVIYGLPEDTFATYVPSILAVDKGAVRRAAQATIDPAEAVIVVVGDRATIEAPLSALKLGPLKVVTADDLLGPLPPPQPE
jgi:predicted Zn-dependent peptidase